METESILVSIKKMLGLDADYKAFDPDIIIHINTYLGVLNQLGVGVDGYTISDEDATWEDFIGGQIVSLNEVKTYIYLRVRLVFDPPTSSILASAINENIAELGWRLNTKVEYGTA